VFHGNVHRHLLTLSLANWAIAIVCWTISAYLGTAQPTGIIVYTVLFVIGIFAVVVAVACYVLADFGTEPHELVTADGPPAGQDGEPPAKPAKRAAARVAKPADGAGAGAGKPADPAPEPTGRPAAGASA
jgi:hypothetical protein